MGANVELRRRIKSTTAISKITRAMEAVSASKLVKCQENATKGKSYAEELWLSAEQIASVEGNEVKSYLTHPVNGQAPALVIVIGSDKGLCGSFNTGLFRQLAAKNYPDNISAVAIGRKAEGYVLRMGWKLVGSLKDIGDYPESRAVEPALAIAFEEYKLGRASEVYLAYSQFESIVSAQFKVERILPLTSQNPVKGEGQTRVPYEFEPDAKEVLSWLMEESVKVKLHQSVLSAKAAEQAARMMAMRNASDSASVLRDKLQIYYNKEHQKQITAEILDTVTATKVISQHE